MLQVGLAKIMQNDLFTNVSAIGTMSWAAPELLTGHGRCVSKGGRLLRRRGALGDCHTGNPQIWHQLVASTQVSHGCIRLVISWLTQASVRMHVLVVMCVWHLPAQHAVLLQPLLDSHLSM